MCAIPPVARQFMTIICCNLLAFSFGSSTGWGTINFLELQNENTTFPTGPLNSEQSAFVVSIPYAGCFVGNFAIVPLSRAIGIKRTIHLFGIPMILSTLLILWAQNIYYLYVSRFLSGFVGGGTAVAIPTFINEISSDNVRGALSCLYDPSYNFGMIISFFIGKYFNSMDQAKIQLIIPIIFIIILFLLPESPEFWLKKNKQKRATKSRKFYRGSIIDPENGEFLPKNTNNPTEKDCVDDENNNASICEQLTVALKSFGSRHAKKAFFVSFTSVLLSYMCCTLVLLVYVTDIFSKTGSSLSENNSSLLISVTTLVGNLVFLNIIERFNRKTLFVGSSILTSISFFMFGIYCFLWLKQPEYEWMPPVCLVCIIYFSSMGLVAIPYILTIEIFPKEIREISLAMMVSLLWIIMFFTGTIFPFVLNAVGLPMCMFLLAALCIVNAIFGIFFLPETRGKSYEEIVALLVK